jgi:hypothetical protein
MAIFSKGTTSVVENGCLRLDVLIMTVEELILDEFVRSSSRCKYITLGDNSKGEVLSLGNVAGNSIANTMHIKSLSLNLVYVA